MKLKQLLAGALTTALVLGQLVPGISKSVNAETAEIVFNKEGLWLTEIYQNDVDRSQKNNKREQSGYESIKLYTSTTDLMEFIEVTSTHEAPINLNDVYEVYYGNTPLTVTDMNGSSDIVITKGQSVVLWNYRSDVTTPIPTEQEFRDAMRIPQNAVVLKASCGAVNWAVTSTFSIKSKESGKAVSTFTATDKKHTQDGFSAELKIPDIGSDMQVYREMTLPSPGYVYSGQLNGLADVIIPNEEYAKGVFITEVRPNDVSRSASYGLSDDFMECLEIINTTDQAVDLNEDYQLSYVVKEGSRKSLTLYHYADTAPNDLSSADCTIPANGIAVIWCYRKDNHLTGYSSFPDETAFRAAYGIPDEVPVYLFTNQNGLNNTTRGFELYKREENGTKNLVSYYAYVGDSDCKDNKSAELMVNPEGPEMLLFTANAATSMGTVKYDQYAYLHDDGSSLSLQLNDTVPESVMQGEELRVNFHYEQTGTLPRTGITTYYRFDGVGGWYSVTETTRRVPNLYEAMISADELFSHNYVEFYVSADNRYRSTLSPIYRVRIDKLNDIEGIRTNISDGEEVGGTVSVTANNGGDNSNSKIYIDGVEYATVPMLEDGAYFTFHADGRDSYFKNAITTTENEWVAAIGKWQYTILDGQAHHIDNSYFVYNAETNNYDLSLRIWAGTYGTTVDEYLEPGANREDFTVTQLALKLINGNVYYPTLIGSDDAATSAKTNLSTDYGAVHSIGDSSGMCPYMDVSFSVPASEVTAVGAKVDTASLSDGRHTLLVTDGASRREVTFIVDNTAPKIDFGIEEGQSLSGNITLDPKVSETNTLNSFAVTLDGEQIELPFKTTAYALGKGEHILAAFAEDAAGNQTAETLKFTVSDASINLTEAGASDITDSGARLYLTMQSDSATQATFYKAERINTAKIETNTTAGILPYIQYVINIGDAEDNEFISASWDGSASNSDKTHAETMYVLNTANGKWDKIASADADGSIKSAVFTVKDHAENGKATVIVQCTADSALPDLDTETDGKLNTNAAWAGDTVPEDYDFCFAWETDTQYYAEEWQHHYLNMNQWIVDNAEERKIKYTIHTGDIVDDCDMIYEWENADEAMRIFDDAGMPYGVLGGNHDVAAGLEDYENYYTYFGEARFANQPTYGGSYKNNAGHYDLLSENGQDFIIVYMSWNIYQEEIDWMNEVLEKYSDRMAILCFHTYANVSYSSNTLLDYYGKLIQQQVVAKNPNVFAVLNGHYHGSSYETAMFDDDGDGVNDRTVYQICTDYQSGFEGGNEYIKFLYFDLDNNKIYMNSYSPCLDDFNFYDDTEVAVLNREGASAIAIDKMVLDVNFKTEAQSILEKSFSAYLCTGEQIGTAALDRNTGSAAVQLSGLDASTDYAWYAVVTNSDTGVLTTGVYEFTTIGKQTVPSETENNTSSDTDNKNISSDTNKETDTSGNNESGGASNTDNGEAVGQLPNTGENSSAAIAALLGAGLTALCAVTVIGKKRLGVKSEKAIK